MCTGWILGFIGHYGWLCGVIDMLNNISKDGLVYPTGSWCTGVGPMNISRMGCGTLYTQDGLRDVK